MMKSVIILRAALVLGCVLTLSQPAVAAQTETNQPSTIPAVSHGWIVDGTIKAFEAGKLSWGYSSTNLPTVFIQWFPSGGVVMHTSVSANGSVGNGSFTEMGSKGWGPCELKEADIQSLKDLVNALPPSLSSESVPVLRRILVHAARSNSLFTAVYDRADIPFELERISEIACGGIDWVVPSTRGYTNANMEGSDTWVHEFVVAANATTAASTSAEGAQIWDLQTWQGKNVASTNFWPTGWPALALSPNGRYITLAGWDSVVMLEVPGMNTRWLRRKGGEYERQCWAQHLASLDGGRRLAVALSTGVEVWDADTGKSRLTLATNTVPFEHVFKSTRDGSALVADMGGGRILIWKAGWTNAPTELQEHQRAKLMEVSPEGRYLAIRGHSPRRPCLLIYDLKDNTRKEMPFRGCFNHEAYRAAWSPDGDYLAIADSGGWPCVLDTKTWKPAALWRVPGEVQHWSGGMCPFFGFTSEGVLLARFKDRSIRALKLPVAKGDLELPK